MLIISLLQQGQYRGPPTGPLQTTPMAPQMAPPTSRPPGPPTMPTMPPMHQPGFPPPASSGAPPMGSMSSSPMGRPNATQMPPLPGSFPGSQVSMSGPSYSGPAGAGVTSLTGPTLSQAAPPSQGTGAGMSHSGLPGGRRMYPGHHAPPSPVENQPSPGTMGMPSPTVSLGTLRVVHADMCMEQTDLHEFLTSCIRVSVLEVIKPSKCRF